MPLHVPPVYLEDANANLPATPTITPGTAVTAGAANVKGAWAPLITSTAYDSALVVIGVSGIHVSASNTRSILDIGIGASSAEQPIINNLLVGFAAGFTYAAGNFSRSFVLPLFIPRGSRVSARLASNVASKVAQVNIALYSGQDYPVPVLRGCDTYGVTAASSSGTALTPGSTGAQSAWASVGSVTTRAYSAALVGFQANNTVVTQIGYQLQIGISSNPIPSSGAEFMFYTETGEAVSGPWPPLPVFCDIPAGAQMQVRGKASGTAQASEVSLHLFY